MSGKPPRCGVCDSLTKSFVCVSCLGLVHADRRSTLQQLRRKRDELLGKLNDLFLAREKIEEKKNEQEQVLEALKRARNATNTAQNQLQQARDDVQSLVHANSERRAKLDKLQAEILNSRTEMLNNYFPHLIRYQSLTYQHVSSMLLHEQKLKLKQILDILPLKVEGMGGGMTSGEGSAILSICGLRVPDQLTNLLDSRLLPEATSAALGYTLLLLDLLGTYLGGPLLHEGSFQGSTTVVWQQQSFWNRRPASGNNVLPLYIEDVPQGNILIPTLAAKSSGALWSFGGLGRANAAGERGPASKPGMEELRQDSLDDHGPLQGSKYAELQAAHNMLQRSISCFVRDLVSPVPGVQLPSSWSAVAWLVMLCALYHRDSRIDGLLQAAGRMTGGTESSVASHGSAGGVAKTGTEQLAFSHNDVRLTGHPDGGMAQPEMSDDDAEEWDVVLPPKPSESEQELEHWTQAMLPHRSRSQQPQQLQRESSISAAAAAARSALGIGSTPFNSY